MARRQFSVSCFCFWFSCCGLPMLRRVGNFTSFLKLYKITEGIFTLHLAMCSRSVSLWSTQRLRHLPAQRREAKSMVHLEFNPKVFTRILPSCPSHVDVIELRDVQSHDAPVPTQGCGLLFPSIAEPHQALGGGGQCTGKKDSGFLVYFHLLYSCLYSSSPCNSPSNGGDCLQP